MSLGIVSNIGRVNGLEPRTVRFAFRPNGASAVTDILDPGKTVFSITRTGAGAFTVVMNPGVAPAANTSASTNPAWATGGAVFVRPDMRTSLSSLGFKAHCAVAGGPTYDSSGRLTFAIIVVDATNTAADTSNVANVVQCSVEWDDMRST